MERITVSEISKQIRGVSYKPENLHDTLDSNAVVLLRANNIDDGKINFDDIVYIDKSKVSKEQYLQKGDILVCASSGSKQLVGKAASVDFDRECTFGAFCKVVRPIPEMADYLGAYFQSSIYRSRMSEVAIGANINNIRNEHIAALDVPIRTPAENAKIVQIINLLQVVIDHRKIELQKLDNLVKARFVEMFGDMYLNTMEWRELQLETMADIVSGITKGRKIAGKQLTKVPYMAVSNVKDGYIDWTTVKTIEATDQEINQYRLLPDDVLMTEGGDPDKLGRGAIIRTPLENCIHQNHIFRVRLDESHILPDYFAEYLKHQRAKRYFLGCAKQTTGIASINMKQLKALPVLLPPLELQNEFSAFIRQIDKSKVVESIHRMNVLFNITLNGGNRYDSGTTEF